MTRRQRIAVAVAAGLAAAFLLALGLAALVDDDPDQELTTDLTSTTTTAPGDDTTTTTELDMSTSSTTAPATTTTARPATTTTRPRPVIDGRGAVLRAPSSPARRTMQDDDCTTLADADWTPECDRITPDLVWLTETRPVPNGALASRAFVFRREAVDRWVAVLEARDLDGSRFTDINVRVEDLSGDGTPEATFGFRRTGSTKVLAVDVVDPTAKVVVHRESPDGSGRVSRGQLDLWEAAGTAYDHLTIRFVDNAWRIVATAKVERSAIPPSHF